MPLATGKCRTTLSLAHLGSNRVSIILHSRGGGGVYWSPYPRRMASTRSAGVWLHSMSLPESWMRHWSPPCSLWPDVKVELANPGSLLGPPGFQAVLSPQDLPSLLAPSWGRTYSHNLCGSLHLWVDCCCRSGLMHPIV